MSLRGSASVDQGAPWRPHRPSLEAASFGLILAVALTLPLEFTKQWFPVSWLELSRVFMVGVIATTAWLAWRQRRGVPRSLPLFAAAAVVAADVLSRLVHPGAGDLKDLAAVIVYLMFAMSVGWHVRRPAQVRAIGRAVVASVLLVAFVALLEEIFDFYVWNSEGLAALGRRNSTLGDPNIAARVLLIGLVVLLGLVLVRRRWTPARTALVAGLAVAFGAAEALTQSRTIWLITVAVVILWLIVALRNRMIVVPIVALGLGMAATFALSPQIAQRAGSIDQFPGTTVQGPPGASSGLVSGPATPVDGVLGKVPLDEVRRYLIRAGVAMFLDDPLTGVGMSGFDPAIRGPYWVYVPADRRANPTTLLHTDAVRVLAETGLLGFAAYVAFVCAFVVAALRGVLRGGWQRAIGFVLLTAFGVILLASQFEGRFTDEPYLWLLLGVAFALPALDEAWRGQVAALPPLRPAAAPSAG